MSTTALASPPLRFYHLRPTPPERLRAMTLSRLMIVNMTTSGFTLKLRRFGGQMGNGGKVRVMTFAQPLASDDVLADSAPRCPEVSQAVKALAQVMAERRPETCNPTAPCSATHTAGSECPAIRERSQAVLAIVDNEAKNDTSSRTERNVSRLGIRPRLGQRTPSVPAH